MYQKEFYIEHIETGLVHAEDYDEAYNKAVQGESETGWHTKDVIVEEVEDEPSSEQVEVTVSGTMSSERSEEIEDKIAEALEELKNFSSKGTVRSEVTGNEVRFNVR